MDNLLNCLIVEDEPVHSNRLKKLLSVTDNRVKVMAVCSSIDEAFDRISRESPRLVFLDIQLQGNPRGGFELLKLFKNPDFHVVFTTAHIDQNILEIRRCGIGYLPKPYIQEELEDAMRKVWEKWQGNIGIRQLDMLLHNLVTEQLDEQLIWLYLAEGSIPVKIKNLVYCKAHDQYTAMYVLDESKNGKIEKIIVSTGLGDWDKNLAPLKFCRIHDSYIINLRHITKIVHKTSSVLLQHVTDPLPLSRAGKERLTILIKKSTPPTYR